MILNDTDLIPPHMLALAAEYRRVAPQPPPYNVLDRRLPPPPPRRSAFQRYITHIARYREALLLPNLQYRLGFASDCSIRVLPRLQHQRGDER